jgi:hypothetical protein
VARPLRIQYPEAFYHVTSRGNEKKAMELIGDGSGLTLHILIFTDHFYNRF